MKASRIIVTVVVIVASVCLAAPVRAQSKIDFVKDFLARYRPAEIALPASPAPGAQPQGIADLVRSGQLPLTMGDLVNLILQNNLDVGVDRMSPVLSQYLIETLYRPFEPTLHMQATVGRNTTPATTVLAGAANPSTLSGSYDIGFSQTLPTGSILGIDAQMSRSSSNSNFSTLNPSWSNVLRYSFTQHLMQNFGRATNLHSVHVAQINQKISNTQFERQLIDLVAQAQRSYWDLVFSAEDIKVKQRSVDLAQKTLSDNQTQVRIGTLAPIDVVQAESDVATRQLQLVTSTYTERQTQDQVKKLITNQGDPGMVLAKLAPMQGVRRPEAADTLPVEEEIRIALENRPEMKQIQLDLQGKKLDVDYARNQLLPTVDFIAQYSQNGVAGTKASSANSFFGSLPTCSPSLPSTVSCLNPDLIGGFGTGLGQLFSYNYSGYSAGVSIQIPLSNRAARGEHARALTDMHTSEQKLNSQAQQIALDVRNALTQVEMSKAQIEASTKARELAERRLEAEQKKFDLGASTIRFVLEEQRNVAQAQTDELQSLVSYTKALVELDRSTGMTLKKNNIEIEKTLNTGSTAR
jgi:outer membrane protein TolC